MKAVIYRRYGGPEVLKLADVPKPSPKADEILIRIVATTVNSGDWRARSLKLPAGFGLLGRLVFGILGPRQPILGAELAGVVESVGSNVSRFSVGDEVIALPGGSFGSHAEYRCMPEDGRVALKPANLTFEEAAALSFGATTALPFLRDKASVRRHDKVLVIGASGAVGAAAVQIAKHLGAEVTAVTSTGNLDLVRSLGADHLIDYTKANFTTRSEAWDVIFDTTGTATYMRCEGVLRQGGRLVVVNGSFAQALGLGRPPKASGKRVINGVAPLSPSDLHEIAAMASRGALRPVIDRVYRLEDAVAAHAYVDTGRKRGSVVLTVADATVRSAGRVRLAAGARMAAAAFML